MDIGHSTFDLRPSLAARREYVASLGETLLIEEAPQNAPVGGAYLLVLYPGEAGPHQVDWYWQPQSHARVPHGARVLFNRAGVPVMDKPEPQAGQERASEPECEAEPDAGQVAFFWAMCNIAARKIARRQPWTAIRMLSMVGQTLDDVKWLVGASDTQPGHGYEGPNPPPTRPTDQLALLRTPPLRSGPRDGGAHATRGGAGWDHALA